MKVIVLGGTGHIGMRLMETLTLTSWTEATGASRSGPGMAQEGMRWLALNTCDAVALARALKGFDAVVNCVAGDRRSIADGARTLAAAAAAAGCPRIIHMSTMSIYGDLEGLVSEKMQAGPQLGWYGKAKREAENSMAEFAKSGGEVVMFRPGCVFGPGSELWVGRTARWLRSGRLGDLGVGGDGWSNLVHVDDVCQAVLAALRLEIVAGTIPVFNLAAPDSPRWNDYFIDLAVATGATPVRRISARQIRLDSLVAGAPLKIAELLLNRLGKRLMGIPDPMPPGLTRLWEQQIRLDSGPATRGLAMAWTSYPDALQSSAGWFSRKFRPNKSVAGDTICTP